MSGVYHTQCVHTVHGIRMFVTMCFETSLYIFVVSLLCLAWTWPKLIVPLYQPFIGLIIQFVKDHKLVSVPLAILLKCNKYFLCNCLLFCSLNKYLLYCTFCLTLFNLINFSTVFRIVVSTA